MFFINRQSVLTTAFLTGSIFRDATDLLSAADLAEVGGSECAARIEPFNGSD